MDIGKKGELGPDYLLPLPPIQVSPSFQKRRPPEYRGLTRLSRQSKINTTSQCCGYRFLEFLQHHQSGTVSNSPLILVVCILEVTGHTLCRDNDYSQIFCCLRVNYAILELDYNVRAHAQTTIFVYWLNEHVHILLQQIWGSDSSLRCCQLVST